MSYTNNWTQVIRQLLDEGHTKEELMKLSNSELEKLHDEYKDKDDEASQKEAKMIKDILDARGDDKEEKLEEMYGGRGRSKGATNAILRANQRVNEKMKAKEPKPEPKPEKKEDIKEEMVKRIINKAKKAVNAGKKVAGKVGKAMIADQRAKGIYDQQRY